MNRKHFAVALNSLLVAAFGIAVAVAGITHDAPEGHYNGHLGTLPPGHAKPHNQPTYNWIGALGYDAADYRDCTGKVGMGTKVHGQDPTKVLVVDWDANVKRLPISDETFALTEDDNWANDIWVIGSCR